MCGIGSDERGLPKYKRGVVSETLVRLGDATFFKEGEIALEALSETTNGDADSVVIDPAC
jgi:hypothetical protein